MKIVEEYSPPWRRMCPQCGVMVVVIDPPPTGTICLLCAELARLERKARRDERNHTPEPGWEPQRRGEYLKSGTYEELIANFWLVFHGHPEPKEEEPLQPRRSKKTSTQLGLFK